MQEEILEIYNKLKNNKELHVLKNEPLSKHTTFKIGGRADILIVPKNLNGLKEAIRISKKMPVKIIGNGSNVLVADRGVRGVVIKVAKGLNGIEFNGNKIIVGSGVLLNNLVKRSIDAGLSGLEFLVGIPGTVGGAVVTNAGAFGRSISQIINEVMILDKEGNEKLLKKKDIEFGYRRSGLKKIKGVIVNVKLNLRKKRKDIIRKSVEKYLLIKKEKQPIYVPSAGCIFKNPNGKIAGKLIEEAECKGLRVGGAEVSKTHANYIINLGDATAKDVAQLAGKVKRKVKERFSVSLKYELIDSKHLNVLS